MTSCQSSSALETSLFVISSTTLGARSYLTTSVPAHRLHTGITSTTFLRWLRQWQVQSLEAEYDQPTGYNHYAFGTNRRSGRPMTYWEVGYAQQTHWRNQLFSLKNDHCYADIHESSTEDRPVYQDHDDEVCDVTDTFEHRQDWRTHRHMTEEETRLWALNSDYLMDAHTFDPLERYKPNTEGELVDIPVPPTRVELNGPAVELDGVDISEHVRSISIGLRLLPDPDHHELFTRGFTADYVIYDEHHTFTDTGRRGSGDDSEGPGREGDKGGGGV
jgi:hypothetical protein